MSITSRVFGNKNSKVSLNPLANLHVWLLLFFSYSYTPKMLKYEANKERTTIINIISKKLNFLFFH